MTPIAATIALLEHFRAFLRSDCSRMRDPQDIYRTREFTKTQARGRLRYLVHVAINRRAGIPDERRRTPEYMYVRDYYRLQDIASRKRVYQFETAAVRARFADRLARYDD